MGGGGEKGKRDRVYAYNIGVHVHVRITASLRENRRMHRGTITIGATYTRSKLECQSVVERECLTTLSFSPPLSSPRVFNPRRYVYILS